MGEAGRRRRGITTVRGRTVAVAAEVVAATTTAVTVVAGVVVHGG